MSLLQRAVERRLERRFVRGTGWLEQRLGASKGIRWTLRYLFPDHWSFLLGEIALYAFIVLVGTGIFLTFYYTPGDSQVIYHGSYTLLRGEQMSEAYRSVLDLSVSVPAGLLFRQVHHWAADVFVASIVLHLCRIFFTGAYRKPRDLNYYIGLSMLMPAILEGFAGYSLVDDLLSGMGLAIAYSVAFALLGIGAQLSYLVWAEPFPGSSQFLPRLEIVHVFLIPVALAVLVTIHLAIIMRQHHSQFPGRGRRERNVVGTPMWPAYALRSIGLMLAVTGILFLVGGKIPFWQAGVWILPIIIFFITRSACRSLQRSDTHPLRAWQGTVIRRGPDGSVLPIAQSPNRTTGPPTEAAVGTAPGESRDGDLSA